MPRSTPGTFQPLPARPVRRTRRHGFSFVELLFAVAVMGIGFIMIAAIFPIGLSQTKLTLDETAGAADSRAMSARLQQLAQVVNQYVNGTGNVSSVVPRSAPERSTGGNMKVNAGLRLPGIVRTLNDPRPFPDGVDPAAAAGQARNFYQWQAGANDLINPSDPRKASVILFKRDGVVAPDATGATYSVHGDTTAQVVVINAQAINQPVFGPADVSTSTTAALAAVPPTKRDLFNLEPRPVAVQVVYDPTSQTWVAAFYSVLLLDKGTEPATYDFGGYPKATDTTPNSPQKWGPILDAAVGAVDTGAFFVVSDDRITPRAALSPTPPFGSAGRLNGHIYRTGQRRPELESVGVRCFDLAPGYSFTPDAGGDGKFNNKNVMPNIVSTDDVVAIGVDRRTTKTMSGLAYTDTPLGTNGPDGSANTVVGTTATAGAQGAVALVLGRGFANSSAVPQTADGYAGAVMDVSAYTTFITVPNQ